MNKNFDYLGNTFQLQLLNEIITDHKFGQSIIEIIDSKYFPSQAFQNIAHIIKNYYRDHDVLLNFPSLRVEVNNEIPVENEAYRTQLHDTIEQIECQASGRFWDVSGDSPYCDPNKDVFGRQLI